MALDGFAPPRTGKTHVWRVSDDDLFRVSEMLIRIRQMALWGDEREVASLREQLTAMPGFPGGIVGDHYEVRRKGGEST